MVQLSRRCTYNIPAASKGNRPVVLICMAIVVNRLIMVPFRIHTALGCFSHMLVADLDLQRIRWTGG